MKKKKLIMSTGIVLSICTALWLLDHIFPLPLEKKSFATVVITENGTPLRCFADHKG